MENIRTRTEMFDYLASSLSGNGIEFGAGAYPFPVGGGCRVLYADRNSVANLEQRGYFGAAKVIVPDLTSDFQEMEGISSVPTFIQIKTVDRASRWTVSLRASD